MSDSTTTYDLAIVGGGPCGLFAAFYAGLREMKTVLIDSLDDLGGQLAALYPEKYIFDVAGFPKVRAKELVDNLVQQANSTSHPPAVMLGKPVSTLVEKDGVFTMTVGDQEVKAKSIILAAGIGAFRPKSLPIPGIERLEGKCVHYSVKNTEAFRGQRVLIVGGGDSAVDWANHLAGVAASVHLIHRRDEFRAHEGSVTQMKAGPTKILTPYELKCLDVADDGTMKYATVFHNATKDETNLGVDHVLVNIGFASSLGPIAEWGLELAKAKIVVNSRMQTNRPGIFAAGDVVTYDGKLALIACGFGDAVVAVCHAKMHVDPKAKLFPGHSSEKK